MQHVNGHIPLHRRELAQVAEQVLQHGLLLLRAVGELMSIGKTYKEAFQKAIRSLETGRYGLGFAKDFHVKTLPELLAL